MHPVPRKGYKEDGVMELRVLIHHCAQEDLSEDLKKELVMWSSELKLQQKQFLGRNKLASHFWGKGRGSTLLQQCAKGREKEGKSEATQGSDYADLWMMWLEIYI